MRVENPVEALKALRERVRKLRSDHDEAARLFRQNSGIGDFAIEIGARWLEDEFDLASENTKTGRNEASINLEGDTSIQGVLQTNRRRS